MSATPLGPQWWLASDGRWYPPPAPAGPPEGPAPDPTRSRRACIRNALALFGTAIIVSIGIGVLVDVSIDPVDPELSAFRELCRLERASLIEAVESARVTSGRYLDVDGLIFVGDLAARPRHHDVELTGPAEAPTGYRIVESPDCAEAGE